MAGIATLRGVSGQPGGRLAALLGAGLEPVAPLRAATGCLELVVVEATAPQPVLEQAQSGLPAGPATAEAVAARLRAAGVEIAWGPPFPVGGLGELLELCRDRGRASLDVFRSDPSLVSALQLGAWFDAPWRFRRARGRIGRALSARVALSSRRALLTAADIAFWQGVREAASAEELKRLTSGSYVTLVYHRFPKTLQEGQERVAIPPRRFSRQLRSLRLLGFRALDPEQLLAFHAGEGDLPTRGYALTVDDALADCVTPLRRAVASHPILFVPTAEVGGSAHWLGDEPVADWSQLRALAESGVWIGSHGRTHRRLTELDVADRALELTGSRDELNREVATPLAAIAYPNGAHSIDVCGDAAEAGYRIGFTTQKGRNGGGTDPLALRRVSVHWHDGVLAILWKVATGEALPRPWERLRATFRG